MPELLEENGIQYSHSPVEGFIRYTYRWRHHPTKKKGDAEPIWVMNRPDFLELLNKWNYSPDWTYYA
jgi:hypothetical protein